MSLNSYFAGLDDSLEKIVSEVLKCDYKATEPSELSCEGVLVYFTVTGDIKGDFCVVFDHPEPASKQFLLITVGDSEAAEAEESCQEIANQITGRILGVMSENGAEIEITYPGKVAPKRDSMQTITAVDGECGLIGLSFIAEEEEVQTEESGADEDDFLTSDEEFPAEEEVVEKKPRVLIVDDSPVMCAFLEKIFLENGFEVAGKAADGMEALELFDQTDPDVVTLDIVMPKLKGTEVLQKILSKRPDAAVVMASSVSDAKTVMSCLKMGAKRYIIKPYDKKAVIGAVEKALGLNMGN